MMVLLLIYAIYTSLSRQRLRKADAKINIFWELPKGQVLNLQGKLEIYFIWIASNKVLAMTHKTKTLRHCEEMLADEAIQ